MTQPNKQSEILIAGITPYFLERGVLWYEQNWQKIKKAAQTQIWWKTNTLFLEKDLQINLFALLRQFTELGYNKVQTIGAPGDFAHRGGIVEIFPINSAHAWRLEFSGNKISAIDFLAVKELKTEKQVKKELSSRGNASLLFGLRPGDYLVHLDHGIGRFAGFVERPGGVISLSAPNENSPEKLFVLEYAKGDKLYVPLDKEEKLSRYIGFETPAVHRLGGALWLKTKRQAKANSLELAKELLALYGQRAAARGFEYPAADQWEKELAGDFPYIETDDQARAIAQVLADMESPKPMDRLICGDVGFGKTEVALRAAFKAAEAGKQVAVLAPTTILANQHWHNFSHRLAKFPVRVALLTRLQSKNEQKKIIKEVGDGKIDILIGTHRLLSKDIQFKNLGLAIIDEEQRFGVKQKEIFNGLRRPNLLPERGEAKSKAEPFDASFDSISGLAQGINFPSHAIDILSLSATPIPRTLNLTLSGLRDISIISTPPPGRLPIKTFVEQFNKKTVANAIAKELARGGQVYYLHNRVETMGLAARQLQKMLSQNFCHPEQSEGSRGSARFDSSKTKRAATRATKSIDSSAEFTPHSDAGPQNDKKECDVKIAVIHGRMHEKQLIKIMDDFDAKKIHILVATTIIENGLDFPNVNTLIVANATRLGLAQAYQLRGRVGRSHQQAFAYFLYNSKNLTDDARSRLEALQEAEALGSGYQVALRDLEIRGAGNVLGREQSGPVNSIGLNLYMQMLSESVEEIKNLI
ncbi:MAG: helicase-related protein [Candidatus Portnoybacteria bacterium]|nr:helicase-related protein [Candidatus Portnoybacteria bacterium]MDD4982619.1 helicase-related protein [Candidatus Portnoybacteria bacterium]